MPVTVTTVKIKKLDLLSESSDPRPVSRCPFLHIQKGRPLCDHPEVSKRFNLRCDYSTSEQLVAPPNCPLKTSAAVAIVSLDGRKEG